MSDATKTMNACEQTESELAALVQEVRGLLNAWDAGLRGVALSDAMCRLDWTYQRIAEGGTPTALLPFPAPLAVIQERIGAWARETFPHHTPIGIAAHIQEKALKLTLTVLGVRDRPLRDDVGGLAVLLLTLCDHVDESLVDIIREEHGRNLVSSWEADDTGLMHRATDAYQEVISTAQAQVIRKVRRAMTPEAHGRFSINPTVGKAFMEAVDAAWPPEGEPDGAV